MTKTFEPLLPIQTDIAMLNSLVEHFDRMTRFMHDQAPPAEIMRILIARGMHDTARRLAECLDQIEGGKNQ